MPKKQIKKQYLSTLREGEKFQFVRPTDKALNPLQTYFVFDEYIQGVHDPKNNICTFSKFQYHDGRTGNKKYCFEDKEVKRYTLFESRQYE